MVFNTGAALLDAIVLSVVSRNQNGTYGYRITQEVREVLDISESTLYPVLRRLLKDGCLESYGDRRKKPPVLPDHGERKASAQSLSRRMEYLRTEDIQNT